MEPASTAGSIRGFTGSFWFVRELLAELQSRAGIRFKDRSGPYSAGQLITITDAIAGATFRYTLDGSTPTLKSTHYTGPIALTSSEMIQAIALGTGEAASDVASAPFIVQ